MTQFIEQNPFRAKDDRISAEDVTNAALDMSPPADDMSNAVAAVTTSADDMTTSAVDV